MIATMAVGRRLVPVFGFVAAVTVVLLLTWGL
jgi:hypothetical protein